MLTVIKYFNLLLIFIILLMSCNNKNTQPKKNDFVFTVCTATYKGKPLPFGKPISEWEKMFGKYTRRLSWHNYVWDSLGIYLRKSDFSGMRGVATEEEPDYICIVFVNLESPIGQAGKLEWAYTRKSSEYVI